MKSIETLESLSPGIIIYWIVAFTIIIFVRYIIFSGAFHLAFYTWWRKTFLHRILDHASYKRSQWRQEIIWSSISAVIFAVAFVGMVAMWQQGYTSIYNDINEWSIWYLPLSVFLVLFLHDAYYYWIHRWMHHPRVYRYVHKVHHNSVHTSVFTSFSFHPLETFLQIAILPLMIIIIPLHGYAILTILILMTLSATINHGGVELYPKNHADHWLFKWIIGATHHDKHHRRFTYNYGLYFSFWDRWMSTEYEGGKNDY